MKSECALWLESEAELYQNRASFEDALFSGKFVQYSWYRLKYFFILQGLQLFVHLIEFFFLYLVAENHSFQSIAVILPILYLLQSGWWGGLERLRDAIRQLRLHGLLYRAPSVIRRWNSAGEFLAAAIFVGTVLVALQFLLAKGSTFISAVLLMYGVRVASGIYLSTLQAATYAIRRTYFPVGVLAIVEVVGVALFLCSWYLVGIWGMVISHVAVTLLQAYIRFTYIKYTYQGLKWRFTPTHIWKTPLRGLRNLKKIVDADFIVQFCSAGFMSTDAIVVFGFFVSASRDDAYQALFLLFFLISPLVRASHDWTRLFYFDLKKVDIGLYATYKHHAEKQIGKLAIYLAVLFATVGLSCSFLAVTPDSQFVVYLYFFFVAHSLFSYLQMKLFCSHRHAMVIGSSLVLLALTLVVPSLELTSLHPVFLLSMCFLGTWYFFRLIAGKKTVTSSTLSMTPYAHWVSLAMRAAKGTHVHVYQVEKRAPGTISLQILELIANVKQHRVAVTCFTKNTILVLVPENANNHIQKAVRESSYGYLKAPVIFPLNGSEKQALQLLNSHNLLPKNFYSFYSQKDTAVRGLAETCEELKDIFRKMFPEGEIYEVPTFQARESLLQNALSSSSHTPVLSCAMRYAQFFESFHHRSQEFVSAYCPHGEMNVIFRMKKRRRCRKLWESWENILLKRTLSQSLSDNTSTASLGY